MSVRRIVALRRLRSPEVARFIGDNDTFIVEEAARAINDDGSIEAALPALARVLEVKRFTSEPLLRRAISANLKIGSAEALARLAAFARDPVRERKSDRGGRRHGVCEPSPLDQWTASIGQRSA